MTFAILELLFFHVVIPLLFIGTLFFSKFKGRLDWVLHVLFFTVYISWILFSGSWDWVSYYFIILWPLLLFTAILISWLRVRHLPRKEKYSGKDKAGFAFFTLITLVFGVYHVPIFKGYTTDTTAITLEFPLENGVYRVGQGGASADINHHYAHPEQQYALDIEQLNSLGIRAQGIYPDELEKYVIYGATISSPCSGVVTESENDLLNLTPPDADPDNPEGNYVKISCAQNDADVLLAHMQQGSLDVKAGDAVDEGQTIGKVGNSGNTTEPHLHIHAEKNGEGIPMEFDERFLVRNSLVWR